MNNGLRDWPVASAYGPSMEGAGTRVCGYAIKNGGLTVEVIRQHLHVCVRTPCQDPKSSGVARAGPDGRGPYRNKWSRSQGTGWGARRVMARSIHEAPVLERHTTRFRAGRQPGPLTAPVLGRGGTCRRPQSKEQLFPSREVCWARQQTGDFCADPFLRFRQCGSCRQARALDAATLRLARQGGEDGGRL